MFPCRVLTLSDDDFGLAFLGSLPRPFLFQPIWQRPKPALTICVIISVPNEITLLGVEMLT